jgi:hypothetical protein
MIVSWRHRPQDVASERTPRRRILPSVIGSLGSFKGRAAIRYDEHYLEA